MDLWLIAPYIGMGPLKFSSTRAEVRQILGDGFKTFKKTPTSNLSDVYDDPGVHLYYNGEDRLEFIESYEPCVPVYDEIKFLRRSTKKVLEELAKKGFQGRSETGSFTFDDLGVVLYAPWKTVEAVSVFRKGYYDE